MTPGDNNINSGNKYDAMWNQIKSELLGSKIAQGKTPAVSSTEIINAMMKLNSNLQPDKPNGFDSDDIFRNRTILHKVDVLHEFLDEGCLGMYGVIKVYDAVHFEGGM